VLKQKLEAKGLVFLNWGDSGWVYLFSKGPVPNVDVLKKQRLYTSAGDDQFVQLYKQNGFNPRPLPFTEVQSGLMTGLLDAVPSTPLATLAFQWYRNVPEMLDLGVGPLAGGTVIDAKTWNSIQQSDRDQILALAKKMQDGLDKEVPAQDTQARAEMVKRGLKVTAPDAAAVRGFREMADKFAASMKGSVVPADIYDQATRERDAFRKTRGTK
jgi:TRAP-type C4-dicarboxylate transport system substrate-binding protein